MASREVAVENILGTLSITDLSIDRSTGHMGNHGVTATPGTLDVTERVVLRSGLGEPDVTAVSAQVTALDGLGNILLDHDGTTSGVDEPCALLHLGDQFLVEEALGLLVQRAVDGNHITLSEHFLETVNATAANLLLYLRLQRLVVVVKELLAVEGLKTTQDTFTDTADGNGSDNLVLQVVFVLGNRSNVPVSVANLVVCGNKVTDKSKDSHDDVFGNGHDVGASDFSDGHTTVGLVGRVEVDVVGTNTGSHSKLQVLGLSKAFCSEISRMEATVVSMFRPHWVLRDLRSGDDDFRVNQLFLKGRVRTLLVGGGHQRVTLFLEPFANAELILGGAEEARLLLGMLAALSRQSAYVNCTGEQTNSRHKGPSTLYPVG